MSRQRILRWMTCMAAVIPAHAWQMQQPTPLQPLRSSAESPLAGSVPTGTATPGEIALTLADAIDRGLRQNLALVQGSESVQLSRAERLRALSSLLPTLNIRPSVTEQQVNLAAFGFTGFPGIPAVVGPFTVYDARAYGSTSLSFQSLWNLRASRENIRGTELTLRDAREQVVTAVTAGYLYALAGRARVEAQSALVRTADVEYRRAQDLKAAGTVPGIDVLRAQVQLQVEQQRLIAYETDFEKQKLALGRAIGLPPGQQFQLADRLEYAQVPDIPSQDEVLKQAFLQRADIRALESRVKAAELSRTAAAAERLPSVGLDANYGVNGLQPNTLHGSFVVAAGVNIPVFQGGRVRAAVDEADAILRQRRAELEDRKGQVDAEVRAAFADLRSAQRQAEVARVGLDLAKQELTQAEDRFSAGVTNNLELVQAQQSLATANDNYISSIYLYYAAKALVIRARGDAEQTIRTLLRNQK